MTLELNVSGHDVSMSTAQFVGIVALSLLVGGCVAAFLVRACRRR